MGFWSWGKKSKSTDKPVEFKCNHKWQDFPWYMQATYYAGTREFEIKLIEPYVCVHCKERKDVVLHRVERENYSWDDAEKLVDECWEKYGQYCKDRPIIEDMINDMQLVDRQYLEILKSLHPEKFGELISDVKSGQLPELKT